MTQVIKPHYTELAGCIFVDKISGVNTHAPDIGKVGFTELLEEVVGQKLFVVHRLDKGTSGALMFAKSAEDAKILVELFEKRQVQKVYVFLTDKKTQLSEIKISSHIGKEKNQFVSTSDKIPNAHTNFVKLQTLPLGDLWEAHPLTGKPHQIRLHAQEAGIPILGDAEHGGSPFIRLCLHSLSLSFPWKGSEVLFKTEEPIWTQELDTLQDLTLWEAVLQRQRLYNIFERPHECVRLSHWEMDSYRIDQFGEQLWVYWYKENDPTKRELLRFENLGKKIDKKILIRKMLNRGEDPNTSPFWKLNGAQDRWLAEENSIRCELRTDSGLSPGLFLDQRENRLWVRGNCSEKTVLNLFSYTAGFSVNAALGGAKEVVTVDVSNNFIEWGKENFKLNNLDPDKYEFWISDALIFLKGCYKRKRKFDLIICDPPSFGRSKNGVFSINKNYEELLINCFYCLNKNGLILFSTNYEKWTLVDLKKNILRLKSQFSFQLLEASRQGLDFELPNQEPLMKSILLRKN